MEQVKLILSKSPSIFNYVSLPLPTLSSELINGHKSLKIKMKINITQTTTKYLHHNTE